MIISEPYRSPPLDSDLLRGRGCISFIFLSLAPAIASDTWLYLVNVCSLESAIDKYAFTQWHLRVSECLRFLAEHRLRIGDGRK